MQLTPERLAELRRIAEAATPGPWEQNDLVPMMVQAVNPYGHGHMHVFEVRGWGHLTGGGACAFDEDKAYAIQCANVNHAAAFDPPTVLALLDEIERLRRIEQAAQLVAAMHRYDHRRVATLCGCSLCQLHTALEMDRKEGV